MSYTDISKNTTEMSTELQNKREMGNENEFTGSNKY